MSSPVLARKKKSKEFLRHFLCIRSHRAYGNVFIGKEDKIKGSVEDMDGVEVDCIGPRDICLWVNGRPVGPNEVVNIKRAVGKCLGMRTNQWYVGYYLTSVGQVSVGEYKSFIMGI